MLRPKSSLWCNDEKARSARRRGAGILPCRRAFFILMFAIFDLGRYAITMQSLRMLANAGARAMMINCYTPAVINNTSPSGCTGDPLPSDAAEASCCPVPVYWRSHAYS